MKRLLAFCLLLLTTSVSAKNVWKADASQLKRLQPRYEQFYGYEIRFPKAPYSGLGFHTDGKREYAKEINSEHGPKRQRKLNGHIRLREWPRGSNARQATKELFAAVHGGAVPGEQTQGWIGKMPFLRTSFTYRCATPAHRSHFGWMYVYNGTAQPKRIVIIADMVKGVADPKLFEASISTLRRVKKRR